jgi:hypothetical protein
MTVALKATALAVSLMTVALLAAGCAEDEAQPLEGEGPVFSNDLGSLELGGEDPSLVITVPEGAESVAIILDALGDNLALATLITDPDGEIMFDFQNDVLTNRTDATDVLYTLLIPNNPAVTLKPGDWTVTFTANGTTTANVSAVTKAEPATDKVLDVNLFFVGLDGLDATTAPDDTEFQAVLAAVDSIFGGAGIRLGAKNYIDVTGDAADQLGVVDSFDGPNSEISKLFQQSAGQTNRALDLFFVADLADADGGFSLLGKSGGVPGPPTHGTRRSGVAVNMASFMEAKGGGDAAKLEAARAEATLIIAHEAGHYLGLYHTTERNGAGLDPSGVVGRDHLTDTANCGDDADANDDKRLSASECGAADGENLMFWSPPTSARALTAHQAAVLQKNALIR